MSKSISTAADGLCGASAPQGPLQELGQTSLPACGGAESDQGLSLNTDIPPILSMPQRHPRLYPWVKLVVGFVLILLFIFGVGSASKYIPGARRMAQVIDERNLRATAIYYTDFEEPAEGSEYIRDCLDYPPEAK